MSRAGLVFAAALALVLPSCSRSSTERTYDAPGTIGDAGENGFYDAPPNDGIIDGSDGSATRQTCTSHFGTALPATPTFGRLDGFLVSIVPPGDMHGCNDDDSHVHLQIEMHGEIYDIAVDVSDDETGSDDVHSTTLEMVPPGDEPWTEGWHTGNELVTDYVALGLHSTDLPLFDKATLETTLETDLASANHISLYTTTYGDDGAHLVHREGGGHDGLIVTNPLSWPSHVRFFCFSDQTF